MLCGVLCSGARVEQHYHCQRFGWIETHVFTSHYQELLAELLPMYAWESVVLSPEQLGFPIRRLRRYTVCGSLTACRPHCIHRFPTSRLIAVLRASLHLLWNVLANMCFCKGLAQGQSRGISVLIGDVDQQIKPTTGVSLARIFLGARNLGFVMICSSGLCCNSGSGGTSTDSAVAVTTSKTAATLW